MSSLKVSVPTHLRELLEPLDELLPHELKLIVTQSLASTEILYDTLVDVSTWAFTDEGQTKLKEKALSRLTYTSLLRQNLFNDRPTRLLAVIPPCWDDNLPIFAAATTRTQARAMGSSTRGEEYPTSDSCVSERRIQYDWRWSCHLVG